VAYKSIENFNIVNNIGNLLPFMNKEVHKYEKGSFGYIMLDHLAAISDSNNANC
jgi:hypothetical protein